MSVFSKMISDEEPLMKRDDNRLTIFPIKHPEIWDMYQKAVSTFWVPEEIDFSRDMDDWDALGENEQFFIKHILAFFSSSDTIVNINIGERFIKEVEILEAKFFYAFQETIENIHSHTYSLLIDTYVKNPEERDKIFNAVTHIPCIKKKADWCFKWIGDEEASFGQRLIAFAIVEGVFFSGAFCSIFWMKEKGKLPGLTFSNELISRDEALHVEFALLLYSMINNRVEQEDVHAMFRDAIDVETNFIVDSIPCAMLGMNSQLMSDYIKFVADRLLLQLGYEKIWSVANPFPFMDRGNLECRTNFFESRVAEYSKANVGGSSSHNDLRTFEISDDF
jgi:ribonucleotide reductase beta subunit family protein with ferritin-like domain